MPISPSTYRYWLTALILAIAFGFAPAQAGMGKDIKSGQDLEEAGAAPLTDDGSAMMDRDIFQEPHKDDLDDMIGRRVIRVLVNMNRTDFFLIDGQPRGFEYELMSQYRAYLKTRVRSRSWPVIFVYVPTPFDELISGVAEGRGDIAAAGLTITPEREKRVAFTDPYFSDVKEVVVTSNRVKSLNSLEDLSGRGIFLNPKTSYAEHLRQLNKKLKAAGKYPARIIEADPNLATEDILELVNAGIVDITIADDHIADVWAQLLPNITVRDDLALNEGGKIAWVVRKENPELRESLSKITRKNRQGSMVGNVLFKRFYKDTTWIDNPLTPEELENLESLMTVFKKYGKRYDFDWLAIAALAFQESRLDHGVISAAGAVGLMQVMPTTAEAPPIEIPDVHEVENNVHAGVKYMAYLRQNYFNDPEITPSAKVDFTLAAYNAGPNRIDRLRKAAKRAGLDPNVWFGNVEQIARRAIGRETVDYVAKVNKYYVAYKLAFRVWEARDKAISGLKAESVN